MYFKILIFAGCDKIGIIVVNAILYENPSFIIVPAERFNYMVILPHSLISNETPNDAISKPRSTRGPRLQI
jgi:hypothetical protein